MMPNDAQVLRVKAPLNQRHWQKPTRNNMAPDDLLYATKTSIGSERGDHFDVNAALTERP